MTADEAALSDLDLKELSDAQLATLVKALNDEAEEEPTALLSFLVRELARRKRRGTLQ